jgi:hypothetical protein
LDDAERSLAFEYVLILEELTPAMTHRSKQTKDLGDNDHNLFMTEAQSTLSDSVLGGIEEANRNVIARDSDEAHRRYPERYRL